MTEYRVNEHITLKLENEKTVIYIDEERFRHCKALIFNFPKEDNTFLEDIESIDELIEGADEILEESVRRILTPEEEFWGHCSTLQAFAENNYNTNLMGGNIFQ